MGKQRGPSDYRDIDAILILEKPPGLSSNQALQQVRKLYRARKAGHCGSLDPLATGVLPVCLGEATKFSSYLLGANKTYRAYCRLGQTTTTGDAEGEVLETVPVQVDPTQIRQTLERYVGEIEQIPPMYSALKHQGQRLYKLARAGEQVERKPRKIKIYDLTLLACTDDSLSIEVSCSKGTYIRTLAEDIGAALGCGAHLTALRRTAVGNFAESAAVTLEELEELQHQGMDRIDALLLPVASALAQFPELELDAASCVDICHGKRIQLGHARASGLCRLVSDEGCFIGLGEVGPEGELKAKRLMNTAR
ncbi:MAG: tRNA pseudouridine(55) synthase TruB [Gammaproteobacteria bacterium]|nr:tRNA pseudouridine(55) synthase TruB [Gammaproteobacteria bacterium]MDH3857347.1 tRNA pseudouridine(55) synthase TruB [Gammaproteobacteria bacterium]